MVQDQNIVVGCESLDKVDLVSIFNGKANVMRSIPHVLKGTTRKCSQNCNPRGIGSNELVETR